MTLTGGEGNTQWFVLALSLSSVVGSALALGSGAIQVSKQPTLEAKGEDL